MKRVADDYGLAPDIDRAIGTLADGKALQKVSILANPAYTPAPLNGVETGLHVALTLPWAHTASTPAQLFRRWLLGRCSTDRLLQQMQHQLFRLQSRGFTITHLDTHQHIHLTPQICDALIVLAQTHNINHIRCITLHPHHRTFYFSALIRCGFARQVLKMQALYTAGRLLKRKLDRAHIAYCPNLVLMPLAGRGAYESLLETFLKRFENEEAEIVTHPGFPTPLADDPYTTGREIEYHALYNLTRKTPCGTTSTKL